MGTLAKNLEKTSKTVLKMKSVDAGITYFFSWVNFQHVLKMAVKRKFLHKNCPKNTLKTESVNIEKTHFFSKAKFQLFEIMA